MTTHTTTTCTCRTRLGCETHGPQIRERAVLCVKCRRSTWNWQAVCDPCTDAREAHPAGNATYDELMASRRTEIVDPWETDIPVCGVPDPGGQVWNRAVVTCNLIAGHRNPNHQAWNAAGRRVAQWAAACTLGAGA
jgi:hypothetical protein